MPWSGSGDCDHVTARYQLCHRLDPFQRVALAIRIEAGNLLQGWTRDGAAPPGSVIEVSCNVRIYRATNSLILA
jgi:hypothetical protein